MRAELQSREERIFLYIGAVCALLGTALTVLAGIGYSGLPAVFGTEPVLRYLAVRPSWYWPAVQVSFSFGALFWVGALSALTYSLKSLSGWIVGRLGTASIIIGAVLRLIDAAISGWGLSSLATAWEDALLSEQSTLLQTGTLLLLILRGTWAFVISYFFGLPFVLYGLAVALSRNYPAWFGWLGFLAGAATLTSGIILLFSPALIPERLIIVLAALLSLWMLVLGILMWYKASRQTKRPY